MNADSPCFKVSAVDFSDKLIISIAAGISTARLAELIPTAKSIVRVMPNTPALVGEGMAGLFADKNTHIAAVCRHFQHFGGKSGAVQLVVHQRMAGDVFVQRLAAALEIRVQRVEEYNKKRHLA